jgi:hypothetical protein
MKDTISSLSPCATAVDCHRFALCHDDNVVPSTPLLATDTNVYYEGSHVKATTIWASGRKRWWLMTTGLTAYCNDSQRYNEELHDKRTVKKNRNQCGGCDVRNADYCW